MGESLSAIGEKVSRWTLREPIISSDFLFALPPGKELANLGEDLELPCHGMSVKLKEQSGWYCFVVAPFTDEASAHFSGRILIVANRFLIHVIRDIYSWTIRIDPRYRHRPVFLYAS
jgi:hypothetical protein